MKSLLRDMRNSCSHHEFWAYAVWLDIATRYRRTSVGVGWLLMPPMAYVLGIGYLYSHMMGRDPVQFVPHLGFGWILWRLSIRTINESADVYAAHQAFIMDGRTRFTDFVLRAFAQSFLFFTVGFLVVLTIVLVIVPTTWGLLTLVLTLPVFMLNVLWMAVIVSLFGARFPDTREMIGTIDRKSVV